MTDVEITSDFHSNNELMAEIDRVADAYSWEDNDIRLGGGVRDGGLVLLTLSIPMMVALIKGLCDIVKVREEARNKGVIIVKAKDGRQIQVPAYYSSEQIQELVETMDPLINPSSILMTVEKN